MIFGVLAILIILVALPALPWLLILLHAWWTKPKVPPPPPIQVALTASVAMDGKAYPVEFTWSEQGESAWNEGWGWHTRWKSSHKAFVRILDAKYAVVVWLPHAEDADLGRFHPAFALLERANPRALKLCLTLEVGEKRDGVFQLTRLKIERNPNGMALKPMTRDEEALKADIAARRYDYLYGLLYDKGQWSQSPALQQRLSVLKGFTPLGNELPGTLRLDPHFFGFEFRNNAWEPLPYSGVYGCYERRKGESGPLPISYRGHIIDQRQHKFWFDETTEQLVEALPVPLEPLAE